MAIPTTLRAMLIRDEGGPELRPYPDFAGDANRDRVRICWQAFLDAGGTVAIGVGRNLTERGISRAEADLLLDNDIRDVETSVSGALPWVSQLDEVRRAVVLNLAYNLGINGLLGFRKFLAAAQQGDWTNAADELLDSRAAGQDPDRYARLARQIMTGAWQ